MQLKTRRKPKYHAYEDKSTSWSKHQLDNIIDEYSSAFMRFQEAGWDVYLLTVEFAKLCGTEQQQVMAMARAVVKFYGAVSARLVGTSWPKGDLAGYQPVGAAFPHLSPLACPGGAAAAKRASRTDQLHMRGILVANRWKKLRVTLDKHVSQNLGLYVTGKIRNIRVSPVESDEPVSSAVEYAFDGLKERIFIPDDIMVLDLADSPSPRPSAWLDLGSCSGYDGPAVFPC
jgi:hypothetical protein